MHGVVKILGRQSDGYAPTNRRRAVKHTRHADRRVENRTQNRDPGRAVLESAIVQRGKEVLAQSILAQRYYTAAEMAKVPTDIDGILKTI